MSMLKNSCQSCGMPFSKDPFKGGSEVDGTRSLLYCSHCYVNGKFTEPDITVEEMTNKVKNIMKTKLGIPRIFHWFVGKWCDKAIPKLKRWQKS